MKIVADSKIPFLKGALDRVAEVHYFSPEDITPLTVNDADALIVRTRTKCNQHLLQGSKVRFIATATIGYDHIDTEWCRANRIAWVNAPGCNAASVQQYIASALVTLSMKRGFRLQDKVLGVVGVGNVGRKVVKLADALGMKVYLNDPPRSRMEGPCQFLSLEGIIRECDIISFHVPLIAEGIDTTSHLANDSFFKSLKKGTIIINTSRGEVVSTGAIKRAITDGIITGAVLDVWEKEPWVDKELLSLVDIATPHIAGYSADGKANATKACVRAVSQQFNLNLNDWEPVSIPPAKNNYFELDISGKDNETVISECILKAYQIEDDHLRLLASPGTFEQQRAEYPVRRDFQAFNVSLNPVSQSLLEKLEQLGFNN